MYWKTFTVLAVIFIALYAVQNAPIRYPLRNVEHPPSSSEFVAVKRDFDGYLLGETRAELIHHLRANGWTVQGPGMFYRPTAFIRRKGGCLAVPRFVNCQLPDSLPQMLFSVDDGKVTRISGYLDRIDDLQGLVVSISEKYGAKPVRVDHISPNDAAVWDLGAGLHLKIEASEFAKWMELYQT